ncbi:uncharacterized protein [Henckelia pumila]|uniref:uncharacterized protein n=1 Tax=Henckelia pumila TaxID=405737 RepID=UPI003C6E0B7E
MGRKEEGESDGEVMGDGEDPHKHLMEFHVVCSSMKPHGVTEEKIQLRAFPFSLKISAKDWMYYLPSGSITTWTKMKRIFLEKYFPASRAANIRKEIYVCKQKMGESLHEYWERFKKLCASCPQHQISENLLIQYCYEGLLSHDRNMLDAQFGTSRSHPAPRKSNEVNVSSLEQQLSELTFLVRHMAVGNGQIAKVCGICTQVGHATDMCPTLQEGYAEQVNAAGGFPGPPQQKYDSYSNTYNQGWRDHPNLRYGNPQANPPGPQAPQHNQSYRPPYPPPQRPQIPTPGESLENLVQNLATNTLAFQQDTRTSIQNLNTQMGQLTAAISKLEAQNSSRLPSQTVVNPKENMSAITLRSGKVLQIQDGLVKEPVKIEGDKEAKVEESEPIPKEAPRGKFPHFSEYKPVAPFPLTLKDSRKNEGIKELYETFRRCEMADRSTIVPRGLLEDVLVEVGDLVFPADLYVLDMKSNELNSPILYLKPRQNILLKREKVAHEKRETGQISWKFHHNSSDAIFSDHLLRPLSHRNFTAFTQHQNSYNTVAVHNSQALDSSLRNLTIHHGLDPNAVPAALPYPPPFPFQYAAPFLPPKAEEEDAADL